MGDGAGGGPVSLCRSGGLWGRGRVRGTGLSEGGQLFNTRNNGLGGRVLRGVAWAWAFVLACGLTLRADVGELLWVQADNTMRRADPTSQFMDTVLQWPALDGATGLAVDDVTGRVYWSQTFGDRILSTDPTGADAQIVVEWPTVQNAVALAVDSVGGKVYWAQQLLFGDQILRADLNGQNVEPLVGWPDVDGPVAIAIDAAGGKLYWAQTFGDQIKQANLDGTLVGVVAQWPEVSGPVALAFDAVGSRMFWAQRSHQNDQIRAVDLTTHLVQTVVSWPDVDEPVALAVSDDGVDLYWARASANADRIRRSDVTGLNVTTVLSWPEVSAPVAMMLTQPSGCSAPAVVSLGSRYFSLTVASGLTPVALRVEGDPNSPNASCVLGYVQADGSLGVSPVFAAAGSWGTVAVYGPEVIPEARYVVRAECGSEVVSVSSSPRATTTWLRGDTDNNLTSDFKDISRVVSGFLGEWGTGDPPTAVEMVDLAGQTGISCSVNGEINFRDISSAVRAFLGDPNPCLSICP